MGQPNATGQLALRLTSKEYVFALEDVVLRDIRVERAGTPANEAGADTRGSGAEALEPGAEAAAVP